MSAVSPEESSNKSASYDITLDRMKKMTSSPPPPRVRSDEGLLYGNADRRSACRLQAYRGKKCR